jgi:16S rRNA (cytidine1402-2'-O)-methyltransferase
VALATDAGTPLVSDPGFRLVAAAREAAIPVWPVPGASAPVAALVASGMPAERFLFDGFLPARSKARRERLALLKAIPATLLFFESPNRLSASLEDMAGEMGAERLACICRELTKLHEEVRCGPLGGLAGEYRDKQVRGEIVLVVAPPAEAAPEMDPEMVLRGLLETMSVSRAAAEAADLTGMPKRDLYALALKLERRLQSP